MTDLIFAQLDYYTSVAKFHQDQGNEDLAQFFIQQGRDLIDTYEESELFFIDTSKL